MTTGVGRFLGFEDTMLFRRFVSTRGADEASVPVHVRCISMGIAIGLTTTDIKFAACNLSNMDCVEAVPEHRAYCAIRCKAFNHADVLAWAASI